MTDQTRRLQDPETIRLHMGELTASEMRVAQAAIRYALAGVQGGGDASAVVWAYRYKQPHADGVTYKTFRHPVEEMGYDGNTIDWWVYGVEPAAEGERG